MAIEALSTANHIVPLVPLQPLAQQVVVDGPATPVPGGFASVLNGLLERNQRDNAAADVAIQDLATGKSQDLHTVALAVSQADVSFRLILEMRNRLTDAFQEVTRMQV